VVTWGHPYLWAATAAPWPQELDGTIDVTQVFSTSAAFAALRADGSVVSWGSVGYGGDSSAVDAALDGTIDVTQMFSSSGSAAFAALRADGSVVTWGDASRGGDSSAVADKTRWHDRRDAGVFKLQCLCRAARRWLGGDLGLCRLLAATAAPWRYETRWHDRRDAGVFDVSGAFAALRADGSVVTWGSSFGWGGDSSAVAAALDGTIDVTQVFSTLYAFAALRADGSVVTWGDAGYWRRQQRRGRRNSMARST
jgi:hypothetical protein